MDATLFLKWAPSKVDHIKLLRSSSNFPMSSKKIMVQWHEGLKIEIPFFSLPFLETNDDDPAFEITNMLFYFSLCFLTFGLPGCSSNMEEFPFFRGSLLAVFVLYFCLHLGVL